MDYKKQYLKYKRKYLNAKKTLNKNKMSGGDLSIQIELNNLLDKHKLNDGDFKSCLKEHRKNNLYKNNELEVSPEKNLLVIIYAYWCYHCSEFIKTNIDLIKEHPDNNNIVFIEGTEISEELVNLFGIRGFPTILKINKSSTEDNLIKNEYSGSRSVEDLYMFLNED